MKKVLIWDISFKLENVGGPAGYLYNLHEYLKEHPTPQITFLSDIGGVPSEEEQADTAFVKKKPTWKQRLLGNAFVRRMNDVWYTIYKSYRTCNVNLPTSVCLNEFDFIHFHASNDLLRYQPLLRKYHGKTILTSHCPCPRTDEILSTSPKWYRLFRPMMLRMELCCYESADYLMFPCREAREPYEKEAKIRKLFAAIEDKFFYVPTAILDIQIDKGNMQKLAELGIPDDAFVIAYFGRHNHIKGYDLLKEVGKNLLERYPNLYFLCAGRGDIEPLQHPRWIELGFVNNTQELLSQSSLYVLPNRETYFDLVVLEVLRAGIPIAMAENGGNRYFRTLPMETTKGITLFDIEHSDSVTQSVEEMINLWQNDNQFFQELGRVNRRLWNQRFTLSQYVETYTEGLSRIH